jgi:hypothetical protein
MRMPGGEAAMIAAVLRLLHVQTHHIRRYSIRNQIHAHVPRARQTFRNRDLHLIEARISGHRPRVQHRNADAPT